MSFIASLGDWLRKITRSFASASISGQNITLTRHNGDTVVLTTQDTVNNAFTKIKIGTATLEPDSTADTLTLGVGAGISLSANATNDSITVSAVPATQSVAGIMSTLDKTKLDGIAEGAEVNQNAFSNVKIGSTTVAADGKTDTIELVAGTGITLTADTASDKVTIKITDNTYFPIDGGALTGTSIVRNRNDTWLWLNGGTDWNKGGQILFYGPEYSDASLRGVVQIRAVIDETSIKNLNCYPNGDLTWDGVDVVTLAKYLLSFDTSSNPRPYIAKLPNGVMIEAFLSGGIAVDSNGRVTLTFSEAFLDTPICVFGKYSASYDFSIYSSNTARVIVRCTNSSGSALASGTSVGIAMIALGRWK